MNIKMNISLGPTGIDKDELLEGLDKYQHEAVVYDNNKNLLCNAIAGSGKTHVLTTKVAWLIANGVEPTKIMLLTFTNKAAKEMLDRVSAKFNNIPMGVKAGTFHSIAARYLRKYSYIVGYGKNFTIIDQKESRDLISQIRKKYIDDNDFSAEFKKQFMKANIMQNIYTKEINLRRKLESMDIPNNHKKHVRNILNQYQYLKKEANLMDFDDLLVNFELALRDPFVRSDIQKEISHVLIDEYQDINYLQDSIIKSISNKENVFAVGDPSQSIYGFRGSDIAYIEEFTKEYKSEEINLKNNYRSDRNILKLAQNAINKNPQKKDVEMKAYRDTDYEQKYNEYYHIEEEISQIVDSVEELIASGVSRDEIAILIRSTGQATLMLETAIRRADIPYELRAGLSYFDRAHIKDVISILTLLVNPKCIISFSRSVGLIDGVGEKTADKIYEFYKEHDYSFQNCLEEKDSLPGSKKAREGFIDFCQIMVEANDKKYLNDVINKVVHGYYLTYLSGKYGGDDDYEDRLEDVLEFHSLAEASTLEDFLESITLDSDILEEEEDGVSRIVISTMHRSKGLEWDYVFIPFLSIGYFPKSVDDDKRVEEERRLFYVSLTRARKMLYLSRSKYSLRYDALYPSLFLNDMLTE